MYWSRGGRRGGIFKAEMDGSNSVQIGHGLTDPAGITIDFVSLRLFWVEYEAHLVRSSDLEGTDVYLVAQLDDRTYPWGIAVSGGRIYWGTWKSNLLQTSDKTGHDIRTLLHDEHDIMQLTVATANPNQTRRNHCEGQICSIGICVLTKSSSRCIAWLKRLCFWKE